MLKHVKTCYCGDKSSDPGTEICLISLDCTGHSAPCLSTAVACSDFTFSNQTTTASPVHILVDASATSLTSELTIGTHQPLPHAPTYQLPAQFLRCLKDLSHSSLVLLWLDEFGAAQTAMPKVTPLCTNLSSR